MMRAAFIETLLELAETDARIWLLCGDLGYSVLEPFHERFPDRFINVGVAEQNMVGIAAGLAREGCVPFCYSIANFPTLRCLEQLRNDVCYHNCNVRVVAVGGGVAYGAQGYSHHALEDLAVTRALPGMVVAAPGDPLEVRALTRLLASHPGPAYLRLGRAGEAVLHETPPAVRVGHALPLQDGEDLALLSAGGMLGTVLQAADLLRSQETRAGVVSVPFVQPLDTACVSALARRVPLLCTVEDHGPVGGLGDAVAACVARLSGTRAGLLPLSLAPDSVRGIAGDRQWLLARAGLDPASIAAAVTDALGNG